MEIRKAKKLYFCDSGILNHFSRINTGSLFENTCYNLLRHRGVVQYYQQKDGQEIDFIIRQKYAFEAKYSAQKKHVSVLERRAKKISISKYQVVSQNYLDNPHITYGFLL